MSVAAPPKPPPPRVEHPDPEALIKEARRRARRRRLAYLGGALLAGGAAAAWLGFGGGSESSVGPARQRGPQPAVAATSASVPRSGPEGGYVLSVATDPDSPGVLYAGTRVGVFVSRDGGGHWRAFRSAPVGRTDAIAVAGNRVYIGTGEGVTVSPDGGRTWHRANVGLVGALRKDTPVHRFFEGFVSQLTVDPANHGVVYAGTARGIFRSTNAGKSWRPLTGPGWLLPSALVLDPGNPQVVFVVVYQNGRNRVWKSTNGGLQWRTLGRAPENVSALAIDPQETSTVYAATHGHSVYKSTDGGETWRAVGFADRAVTSLAIDPQQPSHLYAGTATGIFTSFDGGEGWATERLGATPGERLFVGPLVVDQRNPGSAFAATNHGVFRRVDGGWQPANIGLGATAVGALAIDGRNVYAGTAGDGVFRSTDRGRRWLPDNAGLAQSVVVRHRTVASDIEALAVDGHVVYAGSWNAGLFRSDDRGRTWRPTRFPRQAATAVAAHDGTVFAAPSRSALVKSADGGSTWSAVLARRISALALDGDNVYAGGIRGVFASTDGGANWSQTLVRSVASLAVDGEAVYAGTRGGGVFMSTDRGATWHPAGLRGKNVGELAVDSRSAAVYAGSFRGLYVSTNGGTSWRRLSAMPITALAIDPADGTVHAGTAGGGVRDF